MKKLHINIIEPTHPEYTKNYNAFYNKENCTFIAGMFYYYYKKEMVKVRDKDITKYQIDIVRQKKKIHMFTTLLHELCHYIAARFFHDNNKLHDFIDKHILTK